MATSKTGSKASTVKKSPVKKAMTSAAKTKTTVKTVATAKTKSNIFKKANGEINFPAIIIAEIIGTFILTLVAVLALQETAYLYVGLTVVVLVLSVGVVSGAHLNPAVTFGLWAARKLRSVLLPVYWVAQFVGAILAMLVLGLFSGSGYVLDFSHFTNFSWGITGVELLGTAVFLFGLMAAVTNDKLTQASKAFGIGLALSVGLLVSATALTTVHEGKYAAYQASQQAPAAGDDAEAPVIPAELYVKGATLNPAVALAATERTESQLSGYGATTEEAKYSRLGLEVIVGTLIGAAIGTNLYLLLAYAHRQGK